MSDEENEFGKVKVNFDKILWYYKIYFLWTYLAYKENSDGTANRMIFLGGTNNLENQAIIKLIKRNNKGNEILKEPYFLACVKNKRYFTDIVEFFASNNCEDIYLILRDEGTDLANFIIDYKLDYNITIPNLSRFIIFQTVCGLKILHDNGFSHNDIKLSNIIISSRLKSKICDLGSVSKNNTIEGDGTNGYLSPLALLGNKRTKEDDMYAVGIVFLELLNRKVGMFVIDKKIYEDKTNKDRQLNCVHYILTKFYDIKYGNGDWNESDYVMRAKNSIKKGKYDEFQFRIKPKYFNDNEDQDNIDLINNLLQINPKKRWKADQVLKLPMFQYFQCENDNTKMKYDEDEFKQYCTNNDPFDIEAFKKNVENIRQKIVGDTLLEQSMI
jgi:serine/threonine protein kinase